MPDGGRESSIPAPGWDRRGSPGPAAGMVPRRGRPRDEHLTHRLLQNMLVLLAERGLDRLSADELASRAGAGKTTIYRRWADMGEVAAAAVSSCVLIPPVLDTGSLRGDLEGLLKHLSTPVTREERAAAALLGQARHDVRIHRALDETVVGPLASAIGVVIGRHRDRSNLVALNSQSLSVTLVQALWWDRYATGRPTLAAADIDAVVNKALLPLLS